MAWRPSQVITCYALSIPGLRLRLRCVAAAAFGILVFNNPPAVMAQVMTGPAPKAFPIRPSIDENSVNLTSGELVMTIPELSVGPNGLGLSLMKYMMGNSLRSNHTGSLAVAEPLSTRPAAVTATWGDVTELFDFNDSTGFKSRSGNGSSFSGSTLVLRDGTVIGYGLGPIPNNDSYLYYYATNVTYPNGLVLTYFYRGVGGNYALNSIQSSAGYQIKIDYSAGGTSPSSATAFNMGYDYCDPLATACSLANSWPTVTYGRSISGSTVAFSITDPRGGVRRITYNVPTTSIKIKPPGSIADVFQYTLENVPDPFGPAGAQLSRVMSANINGAVTTYTYGGNSSSKTLTRTNPSPLPGSTVFAAALSVDHYRLTSVADPLGRTTSFGYPCTDDGNYNVTLAEGNSLERLCDARANVKQITMRPKSASGQAVIVMSAEFPPNCSTSNYRICNQPVWVQDGRGNRSDYSYDPQHGGVLTETLPAVTGVRPQKRYSYAQLYAYVKNASGSLVQAHQPTWMLTQVSECRTAASCTGAADETVTAYEYGAAGTANRLLVRGVAVTSGGATLRTCFSYDRFGQRISTTTPRAGLASCP